MPEELEQPAARVGPARMAMSRVPFLCVIHGVRWTGLPEKNALHCMLGPGVQAVGQSQGARFRGRCAWGKESQLSIGGKLGPQGNTAGGEGMCRLVFFRGVTQKLRLWVSGLQCVSSVLTPPLFLTK